MAATIRGERRQAEVGDGPFDLAAPEGGRAGSRLPEILVGTFLVALFALAGAWFYSTSTSRDSYLAVREPVARGEVIERSDLIVYRLNTDAPIRAIPSTAVDEIVGKVALVDLGTGTLVTTQHLADEAAIPDGWGVVGLDLGADELPSFGLRPGDRVRVLAVDTGASGVDTAPEVLAESAEIVEVGVGNGRGQFLAVTLEAERADRVAAAAARGEVRLIQVPGS